VDGVDGSIVDSFVEENPEGVGRLNGDMAVAGAVIAVADQASEVLGAPVRPEATRRNITISGGEVPTEIGRRILIGDVELEVVRIAAPCKLLDDVIGDGARTALRRRAGTVFRLLSSGTITIGDGVDLDPVSDEPTGQPDPDAASR
ncbi:MAG: MOSC domain-containing protein, partial [Actinomycetota bacterium]